MGKTNLALNILILLLCSVGVEGQTGSAQWPDEKSDVANSTAVSSARSNKTPEEATSSSRRLSFYATLSNFFDSNINHDEESINSRGFVPTFGVHFQDRASRSTVEMDYSITSYSYTNTHRWDRVSPDFRVSYERRLTRRWAARTSSEVLLKGSLEDQEIANQYLLTQAIQYRLTSASRLQAYGTYRLKRYPDNSRRDAINTYFGGSFEQRFGERRRWELDYRYETNRTHGPRYRYIRWTYGTEFSTPLFNSRDRLKLEARYRPQLYARQVRVGGERVPRHDRRWILEASWEHPLARDLRVALFYRFDTRNSNDPGRNFNAHLAGVTFTFRWLKLF